MFALIKLTNLMRDKRLGVSEMTILGSEAVFEPPLNQHPACEIHVRLEKLATGCWSVQAAAGTRGGVFRDYASATKFIRREFAARQRTVVETFPA